MIYCNCCHKILATIQESEEIYVRGEVTLTIVCNSCNEVNHIKLYEYNKERMNKSK